MDLRNTTVYKFYARLSHVGIDKHTPDNVRKYVLLGNSINLTTLTLIVPFTFLFFILGMPRLAILLGGLFFLFSFYHYLTSRRYHYLSRVAMMFSLNFALGFYAVVVGKKAGLHFLYVVFFTLPFLVFSLKNYVVITLNCLCTLVLFFMVRFEVIAAQVQLSNFYYYIISSSITVVTFAWLLLNKLYLLQANYTIERNLKRSNQQLEYRNRDLEQFAYVASHDLQEPLRTVISYVELIEKRYNDKLDDKGRQYMGYVVQSSHRLKKLIKDLLDYSRIGRNYRAERIDTGLIMEQSLYQLKHTISDAGAVVQVTGLPVLTAHAADINLLFLNLLDNAVKFRKRDVAPVVNVSADLINGYWRFAFTDNGIGIEAPYLERIFVIFQRLHNLNEYEGNGIGLSHCKKIVEMHGGAIWAESEYGKGSTFYFTLPA